MNFTAKVFCFLGINLMLFFFTLSIHWGNLFILGAAIFCLTIGIAWVLYKMGEKRIWYFPLSQIIMGGGWMDFGVWWDITMVLGFTLILLVPSLIVAVVYAIIMKRKGHKVRDKHDHPQEKSQ